MPAYKSRLVYRTKMTAWKAVKMCKNSWGLIISTFARNTGSTGFVSEIRTGNSILKVKKMVKRTWK